MKLSAMTILPLATLLMLISSTFVKFPSVAVTPDHLERLVYYPKAVTLETLTIYNPLSSQCDHDPLVTASNQIIDTTALRAGNIRWMALSRDLLKRWGGTIQYGDTVWLDAGDKTIDGRWIVQDTMNKKFTQHGDLLFDQSTRALGKWNNVTLTLSSNLSPTHTASLY